ncbi:rhomboid family intramembrane serine protease [Halarchaeum grantii]|uniref:Rhomboid family intramembrane serine protease n=1 Tax=Halarchaeum grantii TaxID=1193105 RepID=A0A830F223_9EURY|nr:rhomboid family intramembrane serine protease [Halarchaeum grantii]GGL31940.1 rhomboid family intramembrane serine protease [Halarchaeum grantii]
MATCDRCGTQVGMPYRCRFCGGSYCEEHRLPESHDCPGLEEWNDPSGVFGEYEEEERSRVDRAVDAVSATGGPLGYLRGNATYVFLGLMALTALAQYIVAPLFGVAVNSGPWVDLFTLNTYNLTHVYPWFVSIFAHGGFGHLLFNGIALYFFGPPVERRMGSAKFAVLFVGAGVLAGLAQVLTAAALGDVAAVYGASGAIMAVMGVLTVLNPGLRVYLYFVIPMPLWVLTLGFATYSLFVTGFFGPGSGGVAQVAHLAGLGVGLLYGAYLKSRGGRGPNQLQLGGGRRGPGGGRGPF